MGDRGRLRRHCRNGQHHDFTVAREVNLSRQYFADVLTEPVGSAYTTITATTETVLIPTALTGIPANEPRASKIYELTVGGTVTTGAAGTLTITPRYGLVIGGTALGASGAQNYVPSITTAPFIYRCLLIIRSLGLPGANSTVTCTGNGKRWRGRHRIESNLGSSRRSVAISVDTSVAAGLWIGRPSCCAIAHPAMAYVAFAKLNKERRWS